MTARSVRKSILARDLPPIWRDDSRFAPDEWVSVVIRPEGGDKELARADSLDEIMDIISRRAGARGLTEDKLREMLQQDD